MAVIKVMWITGTSLAGRTLHFNLNTIMGLEEYNSDDYLIYLRDGATLLLEDCTFSEDYPTLS